MFKVEIKESSREFNGKERIMVKDYSNATPIDSLLDDGDVKITVVDYAVLDVVNDASKGDKEYTKYVLIDDEGKKYVTGSPSFWDSFKNIADELAGEPFTIECYKRDSKNFKGKYFISCSLVG